MNVLTFLSVFCLLFPIINFAENEEIDIPKYISIRDSHYKNFLEKRNRNEKIIEDNLEEFNKSILRKDFLPQKIVLEQNIEENVKEPVEEEIIFFDDTNDITDFNSCELSLILEDGVDEKWKDKAISQMNKIPDTLKMSLGSKGWQIIITDRSIGDFVFYGQYGRCCGASLYPEKIIYVEDREKGIDAILHEIGHAISFENGNLDSSEEFIEMYYGEDKNSYDLLKKKENAEGFANIVYMILNGYDLSNIPKCKEYVSNYIYNSF